MKWIKKILSFLFIVFLYFLPSIIFQRNSDFYENLNGPKLPSIVFPIVWTILYILVAIFIIYIFEHKEEYRSKDFKRVILFLAINYLVNFTFPYFFFVKESLFMGYVITLFSLLTITITTIEALLLNKKITLLLVPYIIWAIIASIFGILLYLNN